MFDKSAYMKRYRKEHPEVWQRFLDNHPNYKKLQDKKLRPVYNKKRVRFKGKQIFTKLMPRTGYCSKCSNNIFDGSCKITVIHHIQYHDDDILKDTVELCVSCHIRGHRNGDKR
jgi:hypothetical protein